MASAGEVSVSDIGSLASLMHLLRFQRKIIHSLIPAATEDGGAAIGQDEDEDEKQQRGEDWNDPDVLLVLARGLGLRTIVASILRLYDGPSHLVIVINAKAEEESGLRQELTTMGVRKPGLRSIRHDTNAKDRQELYLSGGLISVTTRILVVDMINKTIPTDLITGMIVLHAEQITHTCTETFVINLYRKENKEGFLKAFSDSPDHFAIGLSPLQGVLTQLQIRRVELWPRFHKDVIRDLGRRKADVIELSQNMSPSMRRIQNAIVECLEATLGELRRGAGNALVEDATVENAIFKSFQFIIRRQLDSVWNKIGHKTRRLVTDLGDLRRLLDYLLAYDSVKFHEYLESVLLAQTNPASNNALTRQDQSPWLLMEAANTIFSEAKARAFVGEIRKDAAPSAGTEELDILDQEEAAAMEAIGQGPRVDRRDKDRPSWLPPGIDVTLEELPKWQLLREVLDEIEQDIHWSSTDLTSSRNNTILIMVDSNHTCWQLREYLSTMKASTMGSAAKDDHPGRPMMMRQLRRYFEWKQGISAIKTNLRDPVFTATSAQAPATVNSNNLASVQGNQNANYESAALQRKEIWQGGRAPLHKRRRQRGGAAAGLPSRPRTTANATEILETESDDVAQFLRNAMQQVDEDQSVDELPSEVTARHFTELDFETYFGVLQMEDLVVIRPYSGDDDDHHLQELKPRFVIMYDSDAAFVRRLEVYRTAQPGVDMRIYFLMYSESVEEQRYLSDIRREKESFERLIREKATMALPLQADGTPAETSENDRLLRTINSRLAGGQHMASKEPPRVIVDLREFRSSLPFMLHAAGMQLCPATLTVGDYILSPSICVERKSLSDLIQSFNKGRLYTQCELMSATYVHPVLLIEFDESKAFSLQTINDTRTKSAPRPITARTKPSEIDIQAKLVLLTLHFPRLRIIWSSSPYATADIFAELKQNFEEPDVAQATSIGQDHWSNNANEDANDPSATTTAPRPRAVMAPSGTENTYNLVPQDVLLSLPGITTKNYTLVSRSVRDLAELCEMTLEEISHLIGAERGRQLHTFIHKNVLTRQPVG